MFIISLLFALDVSRAAMPDQPAVPGSMVSHPQEHRLLRPQDDPLRSVLHIAAKSGQSNALNRILGTFGENLPEQYVNATDASGRTILMEICRSGAIDSLTSFLYRSEKVNIYLQDNEGNTALGEAIEYGHNRLAEVITWIAPAMGHSIDWKLLLGRHSTSYSHFLQIFVWSCAAGIDEVATECYRALYPVVSDYDCHPIHMAAITGKINVIRALLDVDGDLLNLENDHGWTMMDIAMRMNHAELESFLRTENATERADFAIFSQCSLWGPEEMLPELQIYTGTKFVNSS